MMLNYKNEIDAALQPDSKWVGESGEIPTNDIYVLSHSVVLASKEYLWHVHNAYSAMVKNCVIVTEESPSTGDEMSVQDYIDHRAYAKGKVNIITTPATFQALCVLILAQENAARKEAASEEEAASEVSPLKKVMTPVVVVEELFHTSIQKSLADVHVGILYVLVTSKPTLELIYKDRKHSK